MSHPGTLHVCPAPPCLYPSDSTRAFIDLQRLLLSVHAAKSSPLLRSSLMTPVSGSWFPMVCDALHRLRRLVSLAVSLVSGRVTPATVKVL